MCDVISPSIIHHKPTTGTHVMNSIMIQGDEASIVLCATCNIITSSFFSHMIIYYIKMPSAITIHSPNDNVTRKPKIRQYTIVSQYRTICNSVHTWQFFYYFRPSSTPDIYRAALYAGNSCGTHLVTAFSLVSTIIGLTSHVP